MGRVDERLVGQRQELLVQRVIQHAAELLRAPPQRGAQIGAANVADEQGVARQHRVGNLLAVLGIEHEDRDRLRRVSRRLEPHKPYRAHLHRRRERHQAHLVLLLAVEALPGWYGRCHQPYRQQDRPGFRRRRRFGAK